MARRAVIACALLFASRLALADVEEIVTLHDGSKFQGALVELVQHDHVTLKLATGEVRKFEWADIEKTEEVRVLPPEASGSAAPVQGPFVTVSTLSDKQVILQRRTGSMAIPGHAIETPIWTDTCTAPCYGTVPPGTYRLAGPALRGSNSFDLPDHGKVRVDGTMGSSASHTVGLALSITGGAFLAVAVSFGVGAIILDSVSINNVGFNSETVTYGVIAGIAGGVGALLLIPGIVTLANSASHATVVQLARAVTTGLRF